ncbi:MAG: GspE/PulE family protein [Balneolaceae bacterium]
MSEAVQGNNLAKIPKEWAQKHQTVLLEENNGAMVIGLLASADKQSLHSELSFITGKHIEFKEIDQKEFRILFETQYGALPETDSVNGAASYFPSLQNELSKGSVIQQVNNLIFRAINMGASDIHIEPYEESFRIRYRLDGILQHIVNLSLTNKNTVISRIKIMAHLDIAEKRRPQDGRIRISKETKKYDLRVSILPTDFGEKVVLRILDKSEQRLNLKELGFEKENLYKFKKAIHYPYGMILVTGPTGSGKTTSLYGALNELNSDEVNITTIEDPIEYNLHGINQTQVRSDIGVTFSHALRSILRQDPNVVMVGEIRDLETAAIAIRAALTGHLVFSTLHTNDAPSAVTRLIDMGIEPFLVASSVRLVMAQRLVRKICTSCKEEYLPDKIAAADLGLDSSEIPFYRGGGCKTCNGTGYKGRTALFEIMPISEILSTKVVQHANVQDLRRQAKEEGMITLREAGIQKIKNGITTPEEVLRNTII